MIRMAKEHKVIVYSTVWCPWCRRVKEFLEEHNIKYEERDVESNPRWAAELVEKSGQTGIPVIDIDGEIIVGFDEPALRRALNL